nr:MAG TPA: hypothetical protein [Caudoviricetes sp.]
MKRQGYTQVTWWSGCKMQTERVKNKHDPPKELKKVGTAGKESTVYLVIRRETGRADRHLSPKPRSR